MNFCAIKQDQTPCLLLPRKSFSHRYDHSITATPLKRLCFTAPLGAMPTKQARVTPVPENHALLKMTAAIKQGGVINIRPWYWFLSLFSPPDQVSHK